MTTVHLLAFDRAIITSTAFFFSIINQEIFQELLCTSSAISKNALKAARFLHLSAF
jgi:hypothetical protein